MTDEKSLERKVQLFDQLLEKDPEIRDATLKHLAKLNPGTVLPEVRADEKIDAAYKRAKEDAVKEVEEKWKQRDFENNLSSEKKSAREKYHLNDEEFSKVEELMQQRRIGSYDAAGDYFRMLTKAAEPAPVASAPSFELPDRKSMKELWEDPKKWSLNEARKVLAELRAKGSTAVE